MSEFATTPTARGLLAVAREPLLSGDLGYAFHAPRSLQNFLEMSQVFHLYSQGAGDMTVS